MLAVRDAIRVVFRTQLDDAPEERITEARKLLNDIYDSFVCRYGPLSSRENIKAFAGDPDQPLLLSLETYDPETQTRHQDRHLRAADAGALRPVAHVETAAEALAVSLNETGEIDWPRMEAGDRPRPRGVCSANWAASSTATRKAASGKPPTAI